MQDRVHRVHKGFGRSQLVGERGIIVGRIVRTCILSGDGKPINRKRNILFVGTRVMNMSGVTGGTVQFFIHSVAK